MAEDKCYPYDVALSYAREDSRYAEYLADALKLRGVKVFYDQYQKANLWGKDLYTHLSDVYENQALYCVMFLSKHYAAKVWTNREREAAQARALHENREYILPIRLDNTEIRGILSTISYLDVQQETPNSVADMLLEKLKVAQVTSRPVSGESEVVSSIPPNRAGAENISNVEPQILESPPALNYQQSLLLDSELEFAMKRPAIRLQPMAKSSTSSDHARRTNREQTSAADKASDSSLSYKERLLKGYRYQLDGDYDEAMQEYRVIIRNAPELLGELIGNIRALLKLAPKYTVGYRVLGDAYMRQGEYLQAMEAYNKALTIARRAKSK